LFSQNKTNRALASSVARSGLDTIKEAGDCCKRDLRALICRLATSFSSEKYTYTELKVSPTNLIELIELVIERQVISNLTGKAVLEEMVKTGKPAQKIIEERNLAQISDSESLNGIIAEVIKKNPKSVADYRCGKANAVMFLVGQVMRKSSGKANPKAVQELLKERLDSV